MFKSFRIIPEREVSRGSGWEKWASFLYIFRYIDYLDIYILIRKQFFFVVPMDLLELLVYIVNMEGRERMYH